MRNKYLVNKETWEVEEIKFVISKINIKNRTFMKLLDNKDIKIMLYKWVWDMKGIGDYIKYLLLLADYVWYDNSISFNHFQKDYWISDVLMSKIRNRLKEYNIIVKDDKIYYMNPIFLVRGQTVEKELFELFRKKNQELYWIESL